MNSLINKLIQENFDQLNRSVERLNQWQQENKEMISSLTQQYKQMATNFETTSDSLDKVKDDTEALVSEGGKLRKIVDALNEVIVNDERFIKTAEHLQKTAELSQSNMESFDASTKLSTDGCANSGTLWMALHSLSKNWRKSQKSRTTVRSSGREQRKTWKKVSA